MRAFAVFISSLWLVGCSSHYASPAFSQGGYFMVGDESCVWQRHLTPTRIECYDQKRVYRGYRDAMTEAELQIYLYQQAQANASYQQQSQQIAETNEQLRQFTQRTMEDTSQRMNQAVNSTWQAPQPEPDVIIPPSWTEPTNTPAVGPATLVENRWENGVLWCVYSNNRVRPAGGIICPYQF